MAVAVKHAPEVSSSRLFDRMAVASLAGTVYVLGSLGIIFYLIPSLWYSVWPQGSWAGGAFLAVIMLVAAVGLSVLGLRLLGPQPAPGLRAGIAAGIVGFLVVLLLTRWVSLWVEHWVYDEGMFGPNGPTTGAIVVAVAGLVLLALGIRLFTRPRFEQFLVRLDGQGWFSAKGYKPLQGLRVRRGTVFGILVMVGAGIYTMINHGTLTRGPRDWALNIPFTGKVTLADVGDVGPILKERYPDHFLPGRGYEINPENPLVLNRYTLKDINAEVDPSRFVKIKGQGDAPDEFTAGKVVSREAYEQEVARIKKTPEFNPPLVKDPVPASGDVHFNTLTLLPALRFTVPLLLLAVSLWLAWRVVNMPTFADFLIATEAELNKVSWITQRRLVQDTIVVLVVVILLSGFLFVTDQVWRVALSWKPIGVLQIPEQQDTNTTVENRPW
jgi:preprotein translocase SecE subunit